MAESKYKGKTLVAPHLHKVMSTWGIPQWIFDAVREVAEKEGLNPSRYMTTEMEKWAMRTLGKDEVERRRRGRQPVQAG